MIDIEDLRAGASRSMSLPVMGEMFDDLHMFQQAAQASRSTFADQAVMGYETRVWGGWSGRVMGELRGVLSDYA